MLRCAIGGNWGNKEMENNYNKLHIVMYHYTRDFMHSRYPKIKGLDVGLFRKQMEFFRENFNVLRMEDIIYAIREETWDIMNGDAGNNRKPPMLLTFDDGYIDNFIYAMPILEEIGFQGSFFIPGKTFTGHRLLDVNKIHYILASADIEDLLNDVCERMNYYRGGGEDGFCYPSNEDLYHEYAVPNRWDDRNTIFVKKMLQTVLPEKLRNIISSELFVKYVGISEEKLAYELYMTPEQIRTMKRHGMFIGVHGYDHYWLGQLEKERLYSDIDMALEVLDEFIDRDCWVMNYPYGNYSEKVISYVREKGAGLGLTIEPRIADLSKDNLFTLPRLDCNDFPPKSDNYIRIGGAQ